MRSMIVIAAVASLAAGTALAQYAGPKQPADPPATTQTKPATPPSTTQQQKPATPGKQAAAETEAQAKAQIEAKGYSNVTQLKQDPQGMWTAQAMKDGKSHQLSLDTKGQVTQRN